MSPSTVLVLGLAVVLALPLLWRALARPRRFDPFEPIVLFVGAYGTVFVVRPSSMLLGGDLSYAGVDLRETLPLVNLLALCGAVAFLVGYELRPGASLARRLPSPRPVATRPAVAWSLAFVALAALAIAARASGLAGGSDQLGAASVSSDYVLYVGFLVLPAALCLVALALRQARGRLWLLALLVLAASLAQLVPQGRRIFLLPLLGGILVFVYVYRRKRPSLPALLALVVVGLVASYAAVVVREPERRADAASQFANIVRRPDEVFGLILERGDAEMAPVLAGALTAVPERTGYEWGRITLGGLVARPIPRQLWHEKPRPVSDSIVSVVWPEYVGTTFRPAFTPLLSFYWDFGIAGVIVGMGIFGVACRVLYEWFLGHRGEFAAQLIFAASVWYVVVGVRNDPADTVALASFVVLPLLLVARFSGPTPARRWRPLWGRHGERDRRPAPARWS